MTDERDQFVEACLLSDLAETGRTVVEIEGCSILIVRLSKDIYAVRNRCTHLDFPLADGRIVGRELICRRHGARFRIDDGSVAGGAAVRALAVFPVRIRNGRVEVQIPVESDSFGLPWPIKTAGM